MVRHYDTDILIKCFLEDACQKSELMIFDAPVDDRAVWIRRVQCHEHRPADSRYSIEFRRNKRAIIPERSEQPLMNPVERDVVVPRCDHDGHILQFTEKRPGLLILSDLGPLREISSQDDDIGRCPSRQIEKSGGDARTMGLAKVYVRSV